MSDWDPPADSPEALLPDWVVLSNTSISKDVREGGKIVRTHQRLSGRNHVPCQSRNEEQGYKARCCICHEHSGCDLHRIGSNGRSPIQDLDTSKEAIA